MAAQYMVRFADGKTLWISSADSKSMKRKDITFAYRKARRKAEEKHRRDNKPSPVVEVRCVG